MTAAFSRGTNVAKLEWKTEYTTPIDRTLCVIPSIDTKESQYEAFQSIFASIMSAPIKAADAEPENQPFELLCQKYDIELIPSKVCKKKKEPVICYEPTESTHYIAYVNGKKLDPYTFYQARDTQGYCQMFAFFLAIDDTTQFVKVNQTKRIDAINFKRLVYNSQLCFSKSLHYILKHKDIMKLFKNKFASLDFKYYGIKPRTTAEKYFSDYQKINANSLAIGFYVFDQPLVGIKPSISDTRTKFYNDIVLTLPESPLLESEMSAGGAGRSTPTAAVGGAGCSETVHIATKTSKSTTRKLRRRLTYKK